MTRSVAVLLCALAVLVVPACGGDDGDDQAFQEDFPALSERIQSLGEQVGDTIETAENASDQELANEFDAFAQKLGDLREELEDLEPPEDLAHERDDLESAMGQVRSSLEGFLGAMQALPFFAGRWNDHLARYFRYDVEPGPNGGVRSSRHCRSGHRDRTSGSMRRRRAIC